MPISKKPDTRIDLLDLQKTGAAPHGMGNLHHNDTRNSIDTIKLYRQKRIGRDIQFPLPPSASPRRMGRRKHGMDDA